MTRKVTLTYNPEWTWPYCAAIKGPEFPKGEFSVSSDSPENAVAKLKEFYGKWLAEQAERKNFPQTVEVDW